MQGLRLTVSAITFDLEKQKIIQIYSLTIFYNRLETLLSTSKMLNIVLGDFNINTVTHSNSKMQQLMSEYKLIIHEPAHIIGSLLNHFYIYIYIYIFFYNDLH